MGKQKSCGWHGSASQLGVDLADPVVGDDKRASAVITLNRLRAPSRLWGIRPA